MKVLWVLGEPPGEDLFWSDCDWLYVERTDDDGDGEETWTEVYRGRDFRYWTGGWRVLAYVPESPIPAPPRLGALRAEKRKR